MNKLTERLLSEGYTKDYYPDYVKWSNWKDFEYTHIYLLNTVWETPCGLLKNGINSYSHMSHMGINYCPENNNPRFGCPYYDEKPCPHRIDTKFWGSNCIYHQTGKPYNYAESVEKLWDEWDKLRGEAWQNLVAENGYCHCMEWDRPNRRYIYKYDLDRCINPGCSNETCAITKKQRNLKKVNIYYDILRITKYKKGLLEHEIKRLEKGVKKFDNPIAQTDAEIWFKLNKEEFKPKHNREDRYNLFLSEHHGKSGFGEYDWFEYSIVPQNIRIERRETRDLMQDLRDIQEGIDVTHASDLIKAKKQAKRDAKEARLKAKENKVIKNMKKLLNGDDELLKRFAERELKRKGIVAEEKPEQISMF